VLGGVIADGTTITVDGTGKISAVGGGGASIAAIYNNTARYQVSSTAGQTVTVVTTATVIPNLSWTFSAGSLVVTENAHTHSVGDRVIVRGANINYQTSTITNVTTNTWTLASAGGSASGSAASYMLGFGFSFVGTTGSITGGTLVAPVGGDVQLLSLRIHLAANTRGSTTFNLVVPAGSINGAGGDTSMDDVYIPVQQVRQDGAGLTSVGNTIATNVSGSYATFQFGALSAVAIGLHFLCQF
jgi:hypothetical protein